MERASRDFIVLAATGHGGKKRLVRTYHDVLQTAKVTGTEKQEITRVPLPPQLGKRLEAVAHALHCTAPEAASLAVRVQLDRLEAAAVAADGAGREVPAADTDAPKK